MMVIDAQAHDLKSRNNGGGQGTNATAPFASCNHWPGSDWLAVWLASGVMPARDTRLIVDEPATRQPLFVVATLNPSALASQCERAAAAQSAWANTAAEVRARILELAATLLEEQSDTLACLLSRETGAVASLSQFQVRQASQCFRRAAALALQPMMLPLASNPDQLSRALRMPMGVVGVITPFNFPLLLALRSVAPALAVGNAVIVKPDPATPVSGGFVIAEILRRAGLPDDLLQVAVGAGDVGEALCRHALIEMVCFTGSTDTGRHVGEVCGRHLKKSVLELGGKNALIVLDDMDTEHAAALIARSCWLHQGQVCMAAGRVLVPDHMADGLIECLTARANSMRHGDPCDPNVRVGPIINAQQLSRISKMVDVSIAGGAHLVCGGTQDGAFYRPTVLDHVQAGMPAYDDEIFGPVVAITRYHTQNEAIDRANNTTHGLVAAVLSASVDRARRVGNQLRVGMLHINGPTIQDSGENPFGGMGSSGNGWRLGGPCDIELYTQWRWVTAPVEIE